MVVMANHFHLVYTPKGLGNIDEEVFSKYDRYVCHREIGQQGLHFHSYIETDLNQKTVSDHLKEVQKIPNGQQGKKSLHYSNRLVKEHPDGFPEQDLQKYTLGYVQKQEARVFMKGYTEQELKEALDYYLGEQAKQTAKLRAKIAAGMFPAEGLEPRREGDSTKTNAPKSTVMDEWLEYQIEMMKGLVNPFNNEVKPVTMDYFHKKSWNYWKKQNNGLFPQASTQKRFKQSIWAHYLDKRGQEVDVEYLKEISML